jgi:hypothetical protein
LRECERPRIANGQDGHRAGDGTVGVGHAPSIRRILPAGGEMESFGLALFALGALVVKGAFTVALVYVGARLAIRHERGVSS